jgi:hypothetical protein
MTFRTDITKFIRETKLAAPLVSKKVGLDVLKGVQLRSPVDTGRFRASNRLSINGVDSSVIPATAVEGFKKGESLDDPGAVAGIAIGAIQWGDTIHVTNNLPYARPLEAGHSIQTQRATDGIYGATLTEVRMKLSDAIRAIGKGSGK